MPIPFIRCNVTCITYPWDGPVHEHVHATMEPLLLENANWHLVDDYLPCSWDSYNPELAQNFNFRPSFASGNNGGTACYTKSGAFAKEIAV